MNATLVPSLRYFAYGSNMLRQRLEARCTSVRLIGCASVAGYNLTFAKRSRDKSGKATLVPSPDPSARAYGVVFEISVADLGQLDRIEGRGSGYERLQGVRALTHPAGAELLVTTYIAEADYVDFALQPYDWYLGLVLKGAEQYAFPEDYLSLLRSIPTLADPDLDRRARREALAILAELETGR